MLFRSNPSMIDHFGYAEAKWVCERMFEEASRLYKDKLVSTNVRIGQMTGGESSGAWNVAEHIPMLVKSCVAVGKVPDIQGVCCFVFVNMMWFVLIGLGFGVECVVDPC